MSLAIATSPVVRTTLALCMLAFILPQPSRGQETQTEAKPEIVWTEPHKGDLAKVLKGVLHGFAPLRSDDRLQGGQGLTGIGELLDGPGQQAYRQLSCSERADSERRFWWLADPMISRPGNDRWAEHINRRFELVLHERLLWAALGGEHPVIHEVSVIRRGHEDSWRDVPLGPLPLTRWASMRAARYRFTPVSSIGDGVADLRYDLAAVLGQVARDKRPVFDALVDPATAVVGIESVALNKAVARARRRACGVVHPRPAGAQGQVGLAWTCGLMDGTRFRSDTPDGPLAGHRRPGGRNLRPQDRRHGSGRIGGHQHPPFRGETKVTT